MDAAQAGYHVCLEMHVIQAIIRVLLKVSDAEAWSRGGQLQGSGRGGGSSCSGAAACGDCWPV